MYKVIFFSMLLTLVSCVSSTHIESQNYHYQNGDTAVLMTVSKNVLISEPGFGFSVGFDEVISNDKSENTFYLDITPTFMSEISGVVFSPLKQGNYGVGALASSQLGGSQLEVEEFQALAGNIDAYGLSADPLSSMIGVGYLSVIEDMTSCISGRKVNFQIKEGKINYIGHFAMVDSSQGEDVTWKLVYESQDKEIAQSYVESEHENNIYLPGLKLLDYANNCEII